MQVQFLSTLIADKDRIVARKTGIQSLLCLIWNGRNLKIFVSFIVVTWPFFCFTLFDWLWMKMLRPLITIVGKLSLSNIQTNPSKLSMSWYFLFGSELRLDCSNPLSEPHFMVWRAVYSIGRAKVTNSYILLYKTMIIVFQFNFARIKNTVNESQSFPRPRPKDMDVGVCYFCFEE